MSVGPHQSSRVMSQLRDDDAARGANRSTDGRPGRWITDGHRADDGPAEFPPRGSGGKGYSNIHSEMPIACPATCSPASLCRSCPGA